MNEAIEHSETGRAATGRAQKRGGSEQRVALTLLERDVLQLIADGADLATTAKRLYVSEATVTRVLRSARETTRREQHRPGGALRGAAGASMSRLRDVTTFRQIAGALEGPPRYRRTPSSNGKEISMTGRVMTVALVAVFVTLLFPIAHGEAGVGPGGLASDNVTWLKNVPTAAGQTFGGRIVDGYLYTMVYGQGLLIYDVSQPEDPQLVGRYALPYYANNENVATNGEVLLMNWRAYLGPSYVYVFDVSDKTQPKLIDEIGGSGPFAHPDREAAAHTYECIYDCKWAYGNEGQILDLRDPHDAKFIGWWNRGLRLTISAHDVTEVAPGRVLTASSPMYLLDLRRSVTKPRVLAVSTPSVNSTHNVTWPNSMKDRIIFSASEKRLSHRCSDTSMALETWDASRWKQTRTLTSLDQYRVRDGNYLDGQPPLGGAQFGCSPHWSDAHPDFNNGGLVAAAFYGHGLRFLDVSSAGEISEVGYFLPFGGSVTAAYWVTDEIVYTLDEHRGLDVLRFSRSD